MPAAANKTQPTKVSVAQFIAAIENDTRRADAKALDKLCRAITGERPVMWGPTIIGYGRHHYVYETGREGDTSAVGFSPRKASLVLYGLIGCDDAPRALAKLGKHKRGRGCLYITKLADVNEAVLRDLIARAYARRRT